VISTHLRRHRDVECDKIEPLDTTGISLSKLDERQRALV
jgi:hypothetical protein